MTFYDLSHSSTMADSNMEHPSTKRPRTDTEGIEDPAAVKELITKREELIKKKATLSTDEERDKIDKETEILADQIKAKGGEANTDENVQMRSIAPLPTKTIKQERKKQSRASTQGTKSGEPADDDGGRILLTNVGRGTAGINNPDGDVLAFHKQGYYAQYVVRRGHEESADYVLAPSSKYNELKKPDISKPNEKHRRMGPKEAKTTYVAHRVDVIGVAWSRPAQFDINEQLELIHPTHCHDPRRRFPLTIIICYWPDERMVTFETRSGYMSFTGRKKVLTLLPS